MLPAFSDFFTSPFNSMSALIEVIRLDSAHKAVMIQEQRMQRVNDVAKRKEYRKAHGIDESQTLPWAGKVKANVEGPAPVISVEEEAKRKAFELELQAPRKKWLGIF
jgi:hypothetical protein